MSASKDLEALLQGEVKSGFFTAFAVECGFLDEQEPRFRLSNLPDDTLFDLASLTKALATGPLVFQEFGDDLSQPLNHYAPLLPEAFRRLSFHELLAHRSGLPAWWNFWINRLNEGPAPSPEGAHARIAEIFERLPLPGEKRDLYSDLGYILLGYALEVKSGRSLAALFDTLKGSMAPLGTERLGFPQSLHLKADAYIPSAFCKLRGRLLQGEVHDENAASLGGICGHAGLFGSLSATAGFLKALFASPLGQSYLRANAEQLPLHSFEGLLGLRRGNGLSAALFCEGKGMGHLGFVGTAFWLDFSRKKYALFLSNRVISGRLAPRMGPLRREVFGHLNDILLS